MIGRKLLTRSLQRYWRLQRSLTLGVRGIVLDDRDRVILVRHGYQPGWHFPGGGVERGETTLEALGRELAEEVGVALDAPPDLWGIYTNFKHFPGDHIALFVVRAWHQERVPPPGFEIREWGQFAATELPEDATGPVRRRLAEVLERQPRAETW